MGKTAKVYTKHNVRVRFKHMDGRTTNETNLTVKGASSGTQAGKIALQMAEEIDHVPGEGYWDVVWIQGCGVSMPAPKKAGVRA